MNKKVVMASLMLGCITIQCYAQLVSKMTSSSVFEPVKEVRTADYFPELINADIPGAPKLGKPQLIMGETTPVRGEGNGWAAPAVYDWNGDGKKDLLIGEFGSGVEKGLGSIGHFIRVYQNKGTDAAPEFYDDFFYAREVDELKESTGTPLSVYTFCCLAFTPRFADLDNDGFTDLLTGQYTPGYVTWFRGSDRGFLPGAKLKEAYDPLEARENGIDHSLPITDPQGWLYWAYSSADFGDFDNDGDQDMIIGGNALRICKNIGTKSAPEFGKRELLLDVNGEQLKSSHPGVNTVPYVVDWDQDGVLDILLTDSFNHKGSVAVKFYRGLNTEEGIRFNPGVPLFTAKNDEKEFPGSWLNVCVTDWNNDGINDLIIGASIATLNGVFDYDLSWQWEHDTGISKKNNAYISPQTKRIIDQQLKSIAEYQKKTGLTDEELEAKNMPTVKGEFKHYYGKEAYKTLAHQGYTYVMLGEK